MRELNKKQKKVLVGGIFLLLVVIIGGGILLFAKPKNEPSDSILDNHPIEEVEPEEAENMYSTLINECSGALVWDLDVGEVIAIDNLASTNACHTDNYLEFESKNEQTTVE